VLKHITPRIPLKVSRRFGGTFGLHLQGRRISETTLKEVLQGLRWFFACLIRWRQVRPKRQLTLNRLHDVLSQKIQQFK
jgi:hypothetical protein